MFDRLQKKWKVNGYQLILILCTFAIGGSLTGWIGKKIMTPLNIEKRVIWLILYIVIVTLVWPFAVLAVSIFFGQFRFFTGYLKKMGSRIRGGKSKVKSQKLKDEMLISPGILDRGTRIAIFASGAGSNAQKIIDHFRDNTDIEVGLIVCNKPGAGVLGIATREGIPTLRIDKEQFFRGDAYVADLEKFDIAFIVLAGFLWKVPDVLIGAYPGKIINIHPALLPAFGGKSMYGNFVHEAVIKSGDKESGITIHYVDGHYDNGDIIFQARCPVHENDTPFTLAARIHELEHEHYPGVIELTVRKMK